MRRVLIAILIVSSIAGLVWYLYLYSPLCDYSDLDKGEYTQLVNSEEDAKQVVQSYINETVLPFRIPSNTVFSVKKEGFLWWERYVVLAEGGHLKFILEDGEILFQVLVC